MKKSYHHTQIGYPMLALLVVWILAFLPLLRKSSIWYLSIHGPFAVVIIMLLLFVTLTVAIDERWLVWISGFGQPFNI